MNKSESIVKEIIENKGCTVYKTGFPDFLVKHKSGAICFVEVKQGSDKVRDNQKEVHDVLKEAKIPVYVWKYPNDNEKNISFINHDFNLVNYNFIRNWAIQVHETLQAALNIQHALYQLFIEKDIKIKQEMGGYDTTRIFNWETLHKALRRIFTEDGKLLYDQLKTLDLCRNGLEDEGLL